jgi:hypothetical protein
LFHRKEHPHPQEELRQGLSPYRSQVYPAGVTNSKNQTKNTVFHSPLPQHSETDDKKEPNLIVFTFQTKQIP